MNKTTIPGLSDIEQKAVSKIPTILEDVCEPRILPLGVTKLVLFVLKSGECFLADGKSRILSPNSYFPYGGKQIPAIKLPHRVQIVSE